ncbi:MAG: hypothetical protein J3R72DRAFT_453250 [Linnemannia gamsii]|nr:MAG: hypothetical protein J3R72DRAFT_453250 [Linnemannia gamsii]
MKGFSDLPDELLALIADYLTRGDMLTCVLLNRSLSHSFIPFLWRNLNITACYPRGPWAGQKGLFARFKAASIDSGALSRCGRHIRVLRNISADWLPFFGTDVCPFLEEVTICAYESLGMEVDTFNLSPNPSVEEDYDCVEEEAAVFGNDDDTRAVMKERREKDPLVRFLLQQQQQQQQSSGALRRLSLGQSVLKCRTKSVYLKLMRAIPESVEELRLYQWDGSYFGDESVESSWLEYVDTEDVTAVQDEYACRRAKVGAVATVASCSQGSSPTIRSTSRPTPTPNSARHSDILPRIKKLTLECSIVGGTGVDRLLSWFPCLESLALYGSSITDVCEFTGLLRTRCPLLTALHISSTRNKAMGPLNGLGYAVVLCASLRGWKTIILSSDRPVNHRVLWQTSVLHHVDTLETLYLEGFEMDNSGALVGKILDTAPRLKKLYIMPTQPHDMVWQPSELSETTNWACQDLEVLRIRYSFVGRTSDEQEEHGRFQQQLYRQLARLTKLKELILGDMESDELIIDEDDCGDHDFQDTPPSSSPLSVGNDEEQIRDRLRIISDIITPPTFLANFPTCPKMTLESGMEVLKDLKQLRRVGLCNLEQHGFLDSEEDRVWVKENWPLFRQGYRNNIWKSFRRW